MTYSAMIAAGKNSSCAIRTDGGLKCWGQNELGQLGLGDTNDYGNDAGEVGTGVPAVNIGQAVRFVTAGDHNTTCAIRADNETVCWGNGEDYLLGNGLNGTNIGDEPGEMGSAMTTVDFGGSYAVSLSEGDTHICALLASGEIKCWGPNNYGELGVSGSVQTTAQLGTSWSAVYLGSGRTATAVSAGANHTCAIIDDGTVKCWGLNNYGQLGYDDSTNRGYAELASDMPTVNLGDGRTATAIAAGGYYTCAVLDDGSLKCWGYNASGQLGQDSTTTIGDDSGEMAELLPINLGLGRTATSIYASRRADLDYTCAILDNSTLKCWGYNGDGQLGLGNYIHQGDDVGEMAELSAVNLGTDLIPAQVAMGERHTCVLMTTNAVKCFGIGSGGQLGNGTAVDYGGDTDSIGDDIPFVDLRTP
jgi:alpha-tubulin suppressor-like RCC1 family protein